MARSRFDNPEERELFHARESWVPVVFGAVPVAAICGLVTFVVTRFVDPSWLMTCVLVSVLVTLASRIPHVIDNWRTDVVVTDRRLYYRRGIVDVKDHVTDLGSITDVTVDPSILGRMFNYADVRIQTKAGDDDFVLKEIADAYQMRKVINTGRDKLEGADPKPVHRPAQRR